MPRILLGWELGGGMGHVSSLMRMALALSHAGFQPLLALSDWSSATELLRGCPYPILPAPRWQGGGGPGFRARSYADILAIRGFADPPVLTLLVQAWDELLRAFHVRAVIADAAPALVLAATDRLPLMQVSNPFSLPPSQGTQFPTLDPQAPAHTDPAQILETVSQILSRRGVEPPASLPAILAYGRRFVRGLPQLDPYHALRAEPVAPLAPLPDPLPDPAGSEPRFHAYLSGDYPGVELLLPYLAGRGLRGSAFVRNAPAPVLAAARAAGIEVFDQPPPLTEILRRVRVVIHHAGMGVACDALAAGRAQLVLPTQLEQALTGRRLESLGVARAFSGKMFPIESVADALTQLLNEPAWSQRAASLASQIALHQPRELLTSIVQAVRNSLSHPQDAQSSPEPELIAHAYPDLTRP